MRLLTLVLLQALSLAAQAPAHQAEFIFPLEHWHNHSSSVVELPNGDLIVCWFHGSGERTADDVVIQGARYNKKRGAWTKPFLLADTPKFPDTNPVFYLDSRQKLWLFWPAILANEWHTALMKYRVSSNYLQEDGPPVWEEADNLLVIPQRMYERTKEVYEPELKRSGPFAQWAARNMGLADDKFFARLGWFTRTHPIESNGRMIVPLYSDGYSMGLMALSDDGGKTWFGSEPIVGFGNIQPSVVKKKDGTLVAYMRDNGPPPKRILVSESKDNGVKWTAAADSQLPNPGTSVEAIVLKDGRWLMVSNNLEKGRYSLLASLSDDEGKTWKWQRHLDRDTRTESPASYHYPSVIQAKDGSIHVTYSYFLNHLPAAAARKTIKHAHFNVQWVEQGDAR